MADATEKILHAAYNYKAQQGGGYFKVYFENGITDVMIPEGSREKCYGSFNLADFMNVVVDRIAGLNPLTVIRSSFQFDPDEMFTRPGQLLYEFNTGRAKIADGIRTYKNLPYLCDEKAKDEYDDAVLYTCSTSGDDPSKIVDAEGYEQKAGSKIIITFDEDNTASNPTLNVNGIGEYPIYKDGYPIEPTEIKKGIHYIFEFTGSAYNLSGIYVEGGGIYDPQYNEDYSKTAQQNIPGYIAGIVFAGDGVEVEFDLGALEVLTSEPTDGRAAYVLEEV